MVVVPGAGPAAARGGGRRRSGGCTAGRRRAAADDDVVVGCVAHGSMVWAGGGCGTGSLCYKNSCWRLFSGPCGHIFIIPPAPRRPPGDTVAPRLSSRYHVRCVSAVRRPFHDRSQPRALPRTDTPEGLRAGCMAAGVRPKWASGAVAGAGRTTGPGGAATRPRWLGLRGMQWLDRLAGAQGCCGTTGAAPGPRACGSARRSATCWSAWRATRPRARTASPGAWPTRWTTWVCWCCTAWTMRATCCKMVGQMLLDTGRRCVRRAARPGATCRATSLPHGGHGAADHGRWAFIGVVLASTTSLQLRQFGPRPSSSTSWASLIRGWGRCWRPSWWRALGFGHYRADRVMRVNDELDAMRVMGIPHGFRLVHAARWPGAGLAAGEASGPRWNLAGGMLAADLSLGISPGASHHALPAAVGFGNLTLALSKVGGVRHVDRAGSVAIEPARQAQRTQSLGEARRPRWSPRSPWSSSMDALFAVLFRVRQVSRIPGRSVPLAGPRFCRAPGIWT